MGSLNGLQGRARETDREVQVCRRESVCVCVCVSRQSLEYDKCTYCCQFVRPQKPSAIFMRAFMNNYINIRKLTEMMAKVALKRQRNSIRIIVELTMRKMNGKLFIK